MKLAKRFKFYYIDMPVDEYEAFHDGSGEVLVTWNWGDGLFESGEVVYPTHTVEQLLISGDWIVTEVVAEVDNASK